MQDRVNYRFWDTKEKVMLDWGCICQTAFNCTREEGNEIQRYGLMYWVFTSPLRFIPLQSTGLKDKNGKLIFEGDIVKIPDDFSTYGLFAGDTREIYYAFGGFRLKPKWDTKSRGNWLEDTAELEIIGNIYKDKELLNET